MSLKVLCDENIPRAIAAVLAECGCNVQTVARGMSDAEVASLAQKEKRILISFDADFANILNYPPSDFFGIVRLNVHPPTVSLVSLALRLVLARFKKQSDFKGVLIIAEPDGCRVWSGKK